MDQGLVARHRPPRLTKTKAHGKDISRLNHTAFDLAVYASPGRTHPPRKTRFRLLVRLYRTGLVTRRVPSKVSSLRLSSFPELLRAKVETEFQVNLKLGLSPSRLLTPPAADPTGCWTPPAADPTGCSDPTGC